MDISIAGAHNRLSSLLKQLDQGPIQITRRGETAGVIISPEMYKKLRRVEAYLEMLNISREVGEGPNADEIYRASRQELEERL